MSRRGTVIGSLIALLVVGGVGWLAWDLTHPGTQQASAVGAGGAGARQGARGGASGPGGGNGGPGGGGPGGRAPATTVGVAVAERADIPILIDALGTVVPESTVRVRPQVSGVLQQVLYKEGQMVRKGEVLAVIDPRQFEMALQQSSGQRMKDEAQLEAARVTLQRFRTLLQQDSIARQEVDTQAALVKQLEATAMINKANEGTARLNLGYTRIVAPVAGRVGLRTVDIGNVVGPNDTNGVAVITQLSPIDVEFAVPQDQAPELQRNAGTQMQAKALDRSRTTVLATGVFTSLDNQIDSQTGTVRAKARFTNADAALFPSQFVNVQLNVRTIRDAVVVPVASVRKGTSGDFVFVLNPDRTVSMRDVTRGQATVDKVQITSGLQAGERVITEGADRLRDGARVVLPGDSAGGGRGAGAGAGAGRQGAGSQGARPGGAAQGASAPVDAASEAARADAPPRRQRSANTDAAPAQPPGTVATAPATAPSAVSDKPTPQQRQRILDSAQGDATQLERRQKFLQALDAGDPQAVERWRSMQQRRGEGSGAAASDGGSGGQAR